MEQCTPIKGLIHLSQVGFFHLLFTPNYQVSCKGQYYNKHQTTFKV